MSTPASNAAPAAAPSTTTAPEINPASPTAEPTTPQTAEEREEAEYRAEMAKIQKSRKDEEDRLRAEEAEYEARQAAGDEEGEGEQEQKEEPKPKVKTFKVNGREVEVDMSDEGTVDKLVQQGLAATAKFEHAARIQKRAENFVDALRDRSQTLRILQHPHLLGSEQAVADMCEKFLYERLQRESMSPEERQRAAEKEELERLRAKEQEEEENAKRRETETLKEQFRKDYTKKFIQALEEHDLPKNDWTLTRMAQLMRQAIAKKLHHVTPADVAPIVKRQWEQVRRSLVTNRTGEQLIKELGDDVVSTIRKHDVEQFKGKRAAAPVQRAANGQFERQERPRVIYSSAEEMRDALNKKR